MRSILLFVDEIYEDLELWYPKLRLEEAGFRTLIAGPESGKVYKGKHGYPCKSDLSYDQVQTKQFEGLVVPGGYAPDKMRRYRRALEIVREMDDESKMIAFICHAGWLLISAKILKGKNVTGFSAIQDDLENAGARFADKPVVVDGHLISSRTPQDLPHFSKAILDHLQS